MSSFFFEKQKIEFINLNKKKKYNICKEAANWYVGPKIFNLFFIKFNNFFAKVIENKVEEKKRIKENKNDLISLSFISDKFNNYLTNLINIVNYSSRPIISNVRKKGYKRILKIITLELKKYSSNHNQKKEKEIIIVPLKGGVYLLNLMKEKKTYNNVLAIECKRIPLRKNNYFAFGMKITNSSKYLLNNNFNINNLKKQKLKLRIIELCIVSGMTTFGFLLFLYINKIKPSLVEINTIGLSQQGYEIINKLAKRLKIRVKFITGGVFYRLGNFYKSQRDELLTLDEKLVIGDISKFLN